MVGVQPVSSRLGVRDPHAELHGDRICLPVDGDLNDRAPGYRPVGAFPLDPLLQGCQAPPEGLLRLAGVLPGPVVVRTAAGGGEGSSAIGMPSLARRSRCSGRSCAQVPTFCCLHLRVPMSRRRRRRPARRRAGRRRRRAERRARGSAAASSAATGSPSPGRSPSAAPRGRRPAAGPSPGSARAAARCGSFPQAALPPEVGHVLADRHHRLALAPHRVLTRRESARSPGRPACGGRAATLCAPGAIACRDPQRFRRIGRLSRI